MDRVISHPGNVRRIVDGQVLVAVAASGCSACGHNAGNGGGCSIGKLANGRNETLLALPAMPGLRVGDAVRIELREAQLTRAALIGYLLPVLLIVVGALLGQAFGEKVGAGVTADAAAALGALLGLAVGLLVTRLHRPPALRLVPAGLPLSVSPLEHSHV